ncbi:MarR family winged helix-turn-helix transcriptional regulator [Prauserella cavernicola]|uniref:MarR family transcriptional regulator n=1 Tax=Prauserella cavernicola TaxID=2800127 RepID=A0A934V7C0_9PSEU|nr:MarR family transcriptional regulator [Prauserella cavernicola]MBK1787539.1 MarR family transcriptional regulator [Prauserella cavernicola]
MSSDDAAQLWKLNQRLLTVVMNSCADTFDELGLETKEFFVLDEVDTCQYPAALAAKLMIPKASVTMYLRSLVAKGLVRREIDDQDLRRHRLATTDRGREVRQRALDALAAEFAIIMGRLDQRDRDELRRLLHALLDPS